MPTYLESDLRDPLWYRDRAVDYYGKYLDRQKSVEAIEKAALYAAGDHKRAAALLLKPPVETQQSFDYKNLCSDRDRYMKMAELACSMALMLK
jgi:hypothetical protein